MWTKYLMRLLVLTLLVAICASSCSGEDCVGCKIFDFRGDCV